MLKWKTTAQPHTHTHTHIYVCTDEMNKAKVILKWGRGRRKKKAKQVMRIVFHCMLILHLQVHDS